jgi:hypothetical protein
MTFQRKRAGKWIALIAVFAAVGILTANVLIADPAETSTGPVYQKHKKVDPIATNGPIFVNWPKPDVALVFSGEQDGYLEPCGCAGLENQLGGLSRRSTMFKELRAKGWELVPMDAGGQEKRTGIQAEMKLHFTYRALAKMSYAAVGFGPNDLRLDILPIVLNTDEFNADESSNPLVSANVALGGFDSGLSRRYKIIEAGGMKIGITSVLGKKAVAALTNLRDVTLLEPFQAIPQILTELRNAKCDRLILLAHADMAEAKDLAARFSEFDFVMAAEGAEEPPIEPTKIEGANAQLFEVGHKGKYVVVVGLYKTGDVPFRYQRVPLDHRFADAPEIQKMHVDYQHELEQIVTFDGWGGLGIKQSPHPSGRKFAGTNTCVDCHTQAAAVHGKTPHAHATETLEKIPVPPRMFDPECLSCHVTGWEPQKYFPFDSGYLSMKETPLMVGNGCENCHGPAARHAAVENGEIEVSPEEQIKLQQALHLEIVENEGNKPGQVYKDGSVVNMCMSCHDIDNSPDFDFQTYWLKVKHEGKE